jgi:hypothetical protein
MATESFLPALPEGYVFSLAKRQNLLCGFHPGQPMLYLDEERMAWAAASTESTDAGTVIVASLQKSDSRPPPQRPRTA